MQLIEYQKYKYLASIFVKSTATNFATTLQVLCHTKHTSNFRLGLVAFVIKQLIHTVKFPIFPSIVIKTLVYIEIIGIDCLL